MPNTPPKPNAVPDPAPPIEGDRTTPHSFGEELIGATVTGVIGDLETGWTIIFGSGHKVIVPAQMGSVVLLHPNCG